MRPPTDRGTRTAFPGLWFEVEQVWKDKRLRDWEQPVVDRLAEVRGTPGREAANALDDTLTGIDERPRSEAR
jgi:hypothetical protein